NDTDADSPSLSAVAGTFTTTQGGTLVLTASGNYTYTPPTDFTGADTVSYTVTDGTRNDSGTLTLTVTPVNDAPVAANDSTIVAEGGSVLINLAGNDSDPDDNLSLGSIVITQEPAHGTVVINADGTVRYQHNGTETTGDTFTYTIKDASGQISNPASVTVGVTPVNDAPHADNATFNAQQAGSPIVVTLSGSDVDAGDSVQSFRITSLPTQGTLQLNGVTIASGSSVSATDMAAGKLTYVPNGSFDSEHGASAPSFQFQAYDGDNYSNTATATINVADAKPDAINDTASMIEGVEPVTANLVIMFDTSTSMDQASLGGVVSLPGGGTTTRLALAKEAVANLINSYGDSLQKVMLVTFNNGAVFRGWLTAEAAITMINGLTTANGTDYDSALSTVQSNYGTPADVDHTYVYFLSDGSPVNSSGNQATSASVSQSERSNWVNFLNDKHIDAAYAVGIGSDVTGNAAKSNLDTVAWSPVTSDNPTLTWSNANEYVVAQSSHNTNTIVVSDPLQLKSVLEETVQEFNGGLLDGSISGNVADNFGADGAAALKIVGVALDSNGDGVGDVNATLSGTTYTLNLGASIGTLTIDAATGNYSFHPAAGLDINHDTTFNILYTIADGDGSRDTATLSLTLQDRSEVNAYDNYAQAVVQEVVVSGVAGAPTTITSNFTMTDSNGGSAATATRTFTVAAGYTGELNAQVDIGNSFRTNDTFGWTLVGSGVSLSGTHTQDGPIKIQNLAAGTYELNFTLTDKTAAGNATVTLNNLQLTSTQLSHLETHASTVTGNVIDNPNNYVGSHDAWGAVDNPGSEGATLSAINGTHFDGSTTIAGTYGSLTISSTGAYTYTPLTNLSSVGHSETFNYTLTQSDGDSSTAQLVIDIVGSATTTTPISGSGTLTGGTGSDVLLGSTTADTLTGLGGNDHLEGKAGIDNLLGGDGDDILIGGTGVDMLTGGIGHDTFVWSAGDIGSDTIKDFKLGEDQIDLSDLLQGEQNAADLTSYIKVSSNGSDLLISSTGNLNTSGSNADLTIHLDGINLNDPSHGFGSSPAAMINSLVAGADPTIKLDH
ncbi:MAG TPA: tandem-95 repeat protein, partial [Pseudomonas sp.]|nr:tandem-95 repeat protein [Pseudomonas sp.]